MPKRRDLLAAVAATGLAGCVDEITDIVERGVCPEVSLEDSSSKPANKITVEGVGDPFGDEPVAWIHDAAIDDPGASDRYRARLERTGEEEAELVVPVHPADWMGGGIVEVELESEDGAISCSGLELEIESLDPAPGALDEILDEMETGFRAFAEGVGEDPDSLLEADVSELDRTVKAVAAGLQAVAGPENPNDLRAVLDGEAPVLDGHGSAGTVRSRGLSGGSGSLGNSFGRGGSLGNSFGRGGSLGNSVDGGRSFENSLAPSPEPQVSDPRAQGGVPGRPALAAEEVDEGAVDELLDALTVASGLLDGVAMAIAEMVVLGEELAAIDVDDEEVLPEELDRLMTVQSGAAELNRGRSADIQEFTELALGATSTTVGLTGVGAPLGAKLGAAGNAVAFVGTAMELLDKGVPSRLEDIEIEADPPAYNEDFPGEDVPYPGSWTAELDATTEEFTLTWADAIGTIPIAGPGARFLSELGGVGRDAAEQMLSVYQEFLEDLWGVSSSTGPVRIDPVTYTIEDGVTPGRDDESEYFAWELRTLNSEDEADPFVLEEDDESEYWPLSVGVSELRVQTEAGRFQDQLRMSTQELAVNAIDVSIVADDGSEPPFDLDPAEGSTIDLRAEVENANDESVVWDNEGGAFVRKEETEATFEAPQGGTTLVIARSDASGGARDREAAPARSDTAQVTVGEDDGDDGRLTVGPDVGCLPLENTHELTARLDGEPIAFGDLAWTVSGTGDGTLGSDGVFVPSAEGLVTIEFWLPDDPEATDEVSIDVGGACGTLVLEFTFHPYQDATLTSHCLAGRAITDQAGGSFSSFLTDPQPLDGGGHGGAPVEVHVNAFDVDISEGAEWTEEFTGSVGVVPIDDDAGDMLAFPTSITIEKARETIVRDGESIDADVFDGTIHEATIPVDDGHVTMSGEFSDVRYAELGCGPLSHPGWDEILEGI